MEITDKTMRYPRAYNPDAQIKGVGLKVQDDEGVTGEVSLPVDIPLDYRREILGQRVAYEHKSDRLCERVLGGDNRSHEYSLRVLTGHLSGKNYSSKQSEVC